MNKNKKSLNVCSINEFSKEQFEEAFKKSENDKLKLIQSMSQLCFNIEVLTRMLSKVDGILPFYCKVVPFNLFEVKPDEELPQKKSKI